MHLLVCFYFVPALCKRVEHALYRIDRQWYVAVCLTEGFFDVGGAGWYEATSLHLFAVGAKEICYRGINAIKVI